MQWIKIVSFGIAALILPMQSATAIPLNLMLHLKCVLSDASGKPDPEAINLILDERSKTVRITHPGIMLHGTSVMFSSRKVTFKEIMNLGKNPDENKDLLMITDYELDRIGLTLRIADSSSVTQITGDPPVVRTGRCSRVSGERLYQP